MYYILGIIALAITIIAQIMVSVNYRKYKNESNLCKKNGVEIAQKILEEHGLNDIYVIETRGHLSDHYDPTNNVIRLSKEVFNGESIASASIAAHEVGHAIQYKEGNKLIKIRSKLVPFVNLCSNAGYIAVIIGLLGYVRLFYIGIVLISMILLYQLLTLPVEFDASSKAFDNLSKMNILNDNEMDGAKKVLRAAALTYVAGVLASILEIIRLILLSRDN